MCKSYVKISIIIFLIIYIFKVNALYIRQEKNDTNDNKHEVDSNSTVLSYTKSSTVRPTSTKQVEATTTKKTYKETSTSNNDDDDSSKGKHDEESKTTKISESKEEYKTEEILSKETPAPFNDEIISGSDTRENRINTMNEIKPENNESNEQKIESSKSSNPIFNNMMICGVVCCCVVGLIAVSGYKVVKRKSEIKDLKSQEYYNSTNNTNDFKSNSFIETNNNRSSLVNSLIYENDSPNSAYMYFMGKNEPYITGMTQEKTIEQNVPVEPQPLMKTNKLPYQLPNQNERKRDSRKSVISVNRSSVTSVSSVSRDSIVRHSFLNPNLNIIRTGKRTQQLYEATNEHPAIIETFPSLERPFVPAVPIPLEESDVNSLHPHSIYQMYQDETEYENYYAYTIDDKEYIIDPTTNRVLEIHDLVTDEYMLVEEELYLDFSGSSSDDSDSEQQTL